MTIKPQQTLVSIIVPTLNEAANIKTTLLPLQTLRANHQAEIILVDGGSTDHTLQISKDMTDAQLSCAAGRALQLNMGASHAQSDSLLFLHADTLINDDALHALLDIIQAQQDEELFWGRFDVSINGRHFMFPVIAFMMNWRSHSTGIATGDQAIFINRHLFEHIGGFPSLALMEDVEISKRLKKVTRPIRIKQCVATSGRRWQQQGVFKTIWLMWKLRYAYFKGTPAEQLAKRYYPHHFE